MPLWQPHIVSCVKLDAMSLIDLAKEALSLSLSLSLSHITFILRSLHWLKVNERIEYKLSLTNLWSSYNQPTWLLYLRIIWSPFSLHADIRTRSSSAVTLARPSVSSSLQTTCQSPLDMHHLTCGISSLLYSVNLILFPLLVHIIIIRHHSPIVSYRIMRASPHHSHHLPSHHLSLPQSFTPDLKLISFTNLFL